MWILVFGIVAGVDERASSAAIRIAYDDVKQQDLSAPEQQKFKEAVEVLTNHDKRAQYDSLGYSGGTPCLGWKILGSFLVFLGSGK